MNRYNDVFHEEIIVRQNRTIFNILYTFLNIFMYIFVIFAIISLQGLLAAVTNPEIPILNNAIVFLAFAGITVLIYFNKDNLKMDYEYSYTNGVLDIARVKNNKIRKELLSCNTKDELELVAPIMTNEFNRYQNMSEIKKVNAWLNRDIKKYFAIIRKENQKYMLIFEPSEKFVSILKKYNPQKVKTQ